MATTAGVTVSVAVCVIGYVSVKAVYRIVIYLRKRDARLKRQRECRNALKQLENCVELDKIDHIKAKKITESSLSDIIFELKNGTKSPSEVLSAYQLKAMEINTKTNCIVEPIREAQNHAEELEKSERKGDLYGVPFSIKDNIGIKNYDGDCGFSAWIGKPYEDDSVIVKVLKSQGAVPFVKTNVPQTMISFETTNPIHGATRNPRDTSRGVGGSSGGEGALISGGGSLFGIGSDIGGSIRIPASMCGICGLKPTLNRLSCKGTAPLIKGQTCVSSSYGPLSRDVEGLVIIMKALLVPEMFRLDPVVPPVPFREEMYTDKRKLRIGYFLDDNYFHTVPAMKRGVLQAKSILESHGHELVEWNFKDISFIATNLWGKSIFGDAGEEVSELLKGDSVDSSFVVQWLALQLPNSVKVLVHYLLKPFFSHLARALLCLQGQKSVKHWWDLNTEIATFREKVTSDWEANGLDAVLSPGLGCPALPFGSAAMATGTTSYTMMYNVLNFPAGSLPVTKVTKQDVDNLKDYPTPNPWHAVVKKGMIGSEGLPVNVQVAALPWQEELVLRLMKEIEDATRN